MELGSLVRDKLGDDKKAITIFERVLEMDARQHGRAARGGRPVRQDRRPPAARRSPTRSCWNASPIPTSGAC
jgi:hypothetical protein